MKKIFFATFVGFLYALTANAQLTQTIEVTGYAKIEWEIEAYTVDFSVSEILNTYGEEHSFEELKSGFFVKAKAAGFEEDRFQEDKLGYLLLQLPGAGNLYHLEVKTKEELLKALQLAGDKNGVGIIARKPKYKPINDMEQIVDIAVKNSKEKAARLAKAAGKPLGDILSVTEIPGLEEIAATTVSYDTVTGGYYYVTIKFALQ